MLSGSSDPVCERCKSTSSLIWQRDQKGAVICLDCHSSEKTAFKSSANLSSATSESPPIGGKQCSPHKGSSKSSQQVSLSSSSSSLTDVSSSGVTTRRTTRSHERAKAKQQQMQQQDLAKVEVIACASEEADNAFVEDQLLKDKNKTVTCDLGKTGSYGSPSNKADIAQNYSNSGGPPSPCSSTAGRRSLRQGQPVQAPESQPFVLTCSSLEHQGVMYEVGDVVSLLDRDGAVYYAILRGFMCDQYANKFGVITWLLPKLPNPAHFDPAMFILGPEEDIPRSMDQIEFVCHSPQSRHFQDSYNHNLQDAELWLSSIR